MLKKSLIISLALLAIPFAANACTYDNVKVVNGEMVGRWIPCNDENCPDYQRHKRMIENQEVVHVHDVSEDKSTGTTYDKNEHKERDVDTVQAERDAIDSITSQRIEIKTESDD